MPETCPCPCPCPAEPPAPDPIWEAAREARAGDRGALARLMALARPHLLVAARSRLRSQADAEDAVQDALLALLTVIRDYDPARPPLPLLRTLVLRRSVDIARRRAREAAAVEEEPSPSPGTPAAEQAILLEEARRMVAALPASQREAILLTRFRGLSLRDAAAACGRSPGALKVAVHRGTQRLRAALAV